ncbi:hypothetical protein SESBI_10088 [Sesbania bispinosa]|nr:hypothetical protein SESBI_10088 [Sesbania bispinosa]
MALTSHGEALLSVSLNAKLAIDAEKLLQIITVRRGTKVTHEIFEFCTGRIKVVAMSVSESTVCIASLFE